MPDPARYVSTRGAAGGGFADVLLAGLATDGGLFMPEAWPALDLPALAGLPYARLAARVMAPFAGGAVALEPACADAARAFGHPAVVPLVQLDHALWVMELFHGPTLAFKDLALQLVGRLFDEVLAARQDRITIVGATSGDTGSAAIAACRDRARLGIVILHPEGRTSEVQRRQMTTVDAANVANLAVAGDFDDCQALVKAMFADAPFRTELRLAAVNSINWARIAAQIPYYVAAALALGAPGRAVNFAVPTGNFGNVFAAWAARRMGLPVRRLIAGSNRNDILTRFFAANDMTRRPVVPSLSPSMDIAVSSNFERLLFELLARDADATARVMAGFAADGRMEVPAPAWHAAADLFRGHHCSDAATLAEMRRLHAATGYVADPHTAVAVAAARAHAEPGVATVVAATAHPAKFPDAVERAIGIRPALPRRLDELYTRPERFQRVPNELRAVQNAVRDFALRNAA